MGVFGGGGVVFHPSFFKFLLRFLILLLYLNLAKVVSKGLENRLRAESVCVSFIRLKQDYSGEGL